MRPDVEVELATCGKDLSVGGIFVPGVTLEAMSECTVVVKHGDVELRLPAKVVYAAPGGGAGLELIGFNAEIREKLAQLSNGVGTPSQPLPKVSTLSLDLEPMEDDEPAMIADAPSPELERPEQSEDEEADEAEHKKIPLNVHERLRGMNLNEQVKMAMHGEQHERIVLERMYGKTVWEPLLRNPRITGPEVARIARMGQLPKPLIEVICNNGAWLQIPEIRRSLLSNPRLVPDQINRVLRLLPKHELKLAQKQPAYPHAVRDAAKRLVAQQAI